jgi:uncharacterized protein involved in response to NO
MILFALGFRPFYLGAALFGALALTVWVAGYRSGWMIGAHLPGSAWHAHEMLFGFAGAVIVGFLLTAARNWTGRSTAQGAGLAALAALWIAGRLLNLTGPGALAAWVDAAFLPVAGAVLAIPLWRARNLRNFFVVPLLFGLGALNLLHHAAYLGSAPAPFQPLPQVVGVSVAAGLIALLMTVIGGRVIPSFSANAVPDLQPRRWPWIEWPVLGLMVIIPLMDVSPTHWGVPGPVFRSLLLAAAALQTLRLFGWQPWRTSGNTLLLMLPLAYAWIPVYLLLRALLGSGGPVLPALALHALVVGGMASLMLAMMTRSALGHTGRPLRAGAVESISFFAMQTAALLRVAGPLAVPTAYATWIALSGGAAALALAVYAVGYWPVLTRPRIDGRPG